MKTIRIGQIALSFHRASAAYVANLLEQHGYAVSFSEAPHEAAFELLRNGEIDLLVSAWLPGSHGKYLQPLQDEVVELGRIYSPYCIWGVPAYSADNLVNVADLTDPIKSAGVSKQIYTINPGAGISRFSLEMMEQYGLTRTGYTLENLPEEDYFQSVADGIAQKRQFIIPFWHPHFLHYRYDLRELNEPLGLLRSRDEAKLIARKEVYGEFPAAVKDTLTQLYLGNARVSALDHFLHVEHLDIRAALQAISSMP